MRALPTAFSAVTRDVRGIYRRTKRNAALSGLALMCFVSAYAAALVAAGAHLAPLYGPAMAALIIAASMAMIGGLLLVTVKILKFRERRQLVRRRATQRLGAAAAISILPQITRSKSLLLVAALGGLALMATQVMGNDEQD